MSSRQQPVHFEERASTLGLSTATANGVIGTMRNKMKSARKGIDSIESFDPLVQDNAIIQVEEISIGKERKEVRKVYIITGTYKVGWIVDIDVDCCLICLQAFSWTRFRHHCRACGILVCSACSPFRAQLPNFEEENGSRVCVNCFGLRPATQHIVDTRSPLYRQQSRHPPTRTKATSSLPKKGHGRVLHTPSETHTPVLADAKHEAQGSHGEYSSQSYLSPQTVGTLPGDSDHRDNVDTSVDPSILSPVPNVSSRSIGVTRRGDKWVTFVASQGIVAPVLESTVDTTTGVVGCAVQNTNKPPKAQARLTSSGRELMETIQQDPQQALDNLLLDNAKRFEERQIPKYQDSYELMRQIIPPDISRTNMNSLLDLGMDEELANYIWTTKVLWLICMHPNDFPKIHIGDLMSKYSFHGLDICEMRAIWCAIPTGCWETPLTGEGDMFNGAATPAHLTEENRGQIHHSSSLGKIFSNQDTTGEEQIQSQLAQYRKVQWKTNFKNKMDELARKEENNTILSAEERNIYYKAVGEASLYLFDPCEPLVPRYHRSASYHRETGSVEGEAEGDVHTPMKPSGQPSPRHTPSQYQAMAMEDQSLESEEDTADIDADGYDYDNINATTRIPRHQTPNHNTPKVRAYTNISGGRCFMDDGNMLSPMTLSPSSSFSSSPPGSSTAPIHSLGHGLGIGRIVKDKDYHANNMTPFTRSQLPLPINSAGQVSDVSSLPSGSSPFYRRLSSTLSDDEDDDEAVKAIGKGEMLYGDELDGWETPTQSCLTPEDYRAVLHEDEGDACAGKAVAVDLYPFYKEREGDDLDDGVVIHLSRHNSESNTSSPRASSTASGPHWINKSSVGLIDSHTVSWSADLARELQEAIAEEDRLLVTEYEEQLLREQHMEEEIQQEIQRVREERLLKEKERLTATSAEFTRKLSGSPGGLANASEQLGSSANSLVSIDITTGGQPHPSNAAAPSPLVRRTSKGRDTYVIAHHKIVGFVTAGEATVAVDYLIECDLFPWISSEVLMSEHDAPANSKSGYPWGELAKVLTTAQATELLLQVCDNTDSLAEDLETFVLLIDVFGADVNAHSVDGQTPLSLVFMNSIIGKHLLSRDADIFALDVSAEEPNDENGNDYSSCPLAMCLEYGYDWLVESYLFCGEDKLFSKTVPKDSLSIDTSDHTQWRNRKTYVTLLLTYGWANQVNRIIQTYGGEWTGSLNRLLQVTVAEAQELLLKCQQCDFENMKDAVETVELLEQLGAQMG